MATDTNTTGGPGDAGLVDWKIALNFVEGDRALLASVVDAFLQEAPRQMAAIQRAIEVADAKTLYRAAHTLKGSLRYFGAAQAMELAGQLELAGRTERLSDTLSSSRELNALLSQVLVVLSDYLQRESSP